MELQSSDDNEVVLSVLSVVSAAEEDEISDGVSEEPSFSRVLPFLNLRR